MASAKGANNPVDPGSWTFQNNNGGQPVMAMGYDAMGRPSSLADTTVDAGNYLSNPLVGWVSGVQYDYAGRLAGISWLTGLSPSCGNCNLMAESRGYNVNGQLASIGWTGPLGGIDYADQRFYAATYGRFLSPDPYSASGGAGDPGSWNRYSYVGGDPVNFIDPSGNTKCDPDGNNCYDSVTVSGAVPLPFSMGGGKSMRKTEPNYDPDDPFKNPQSVQQAWVIASQFSKSVDPKKGFTECQALAGFANAIGEGTPKNLFVEDLGVLVPNTMAAKLGLNFWNTNPVSMYNGDDNGFSSTYQNTVPDSASGNGNQEHHFAAFFELGYAIGALPASQVAYWFEQFEDILGPPNAGDIALGQMAAQWGADLKAGNLMPWQIGDRIQGLCK